MFCSVTKSVDKEVEVETVCESAQLAQSVHLGKEGVHFSFFLRFFVPLSLSHLLPSIAQGLTSVACWRQEKSPSPPQPRLSPLSPCRCSLAPAIISHTPGAWPHLLEHLRFNPLNLDVLISRLCHPTSEHPVEVVRVGGEDDPVRGEGGRLDQDCHVGEVAGLGQPVQVAPPVLLPAPKLHPCFVLVEPPLLTSPSWK